LTLHKNSVLYSSVMFFVRPFFKLKVEGLDKVGDEPAVFVANHYEIFGPIACFASIPLYFHPWVWDKMLDEEKLKTHLVSGVHVVLKFLSVKSCEKLSAKLSPTVAKVMRSVDPVPVYRDGDRRVFQTMIDSRSKLLCGDNLLIFPENPEAGKLYERGRVDDFHPGFAELGRVYYKASGKILKFLPTYVDKKHRKIVVCDPVEYQPQNDPHEEKLRIARQLCDLMRAQASFAGAYDDENKRN